MTVRLVTGTGAVAGRVRGPAFVVRMESEAIDAAPGSVIVVRVFHPYFAPVLRRVSGLVVEEGGLLQHAVILAREFAIPTVVGARDATTLIEPGLWVTLDGAAGTVDRDGPAQ